MNTTAPTLEEAVNAETPVSEPLHQRVTRHLFEHSNISPAAAQRIADMIMDDEIPGVSITKEA